MVFPIRSMAFRAISEDSLVSSPFRYHPWCPHRIMNPRTFYIFIKPLQIYKQNPETKSGTHIESLQLLMRQVYPTHPSRLSHEHTPPVDLETLMYGLSVNLTHPDIGNCLSGPGEFAGQFPTIAVQASGFEKNPTFHHQMRTGDRKLDTSSLRFRQDPLLLFMPL